MGVLLLKTTPGSSYEVGDVVFAWDDFRISRMWAERLCLLKDAYTGDLVGQDVDGIMQGTQRALALEWCRNTHRLRFRRDGNRLVITDLWSPRRDRIIATEDVAYVDHDGKVGYFQSAFAAAKRRRDAHQFPVFGSVENEVWFGGTFRIDRAALRTIWQAIENQMQVSRSDRRFHMTSEVGLTERRTLLVLPVAAFDAQESEALLEEVWKTDADGRFLWLDENGVEGATDTIAEPPDRKAGWTLQRRRRRRNALIDMDALLADIGVDRAHVDDPRIAVDLTEIDPVLDVDLLYDHVTNRPRRRFRNGD